MVFGRALNVALLVCFLALATDASDVVQAATGKDHSYLRRVSSVESKGQETRSLGSWSGFTSALLTGKKKPDPSDGSSGGSSSSSSSSGGSSSSSSGGSSSSSSSSSGGSSSSSSSSSSGSTTSEQSHLAADKKSGPNATYRTTFMVAVLSSLAGLSLFGTMKYIAGKRQQQSKTKSLAQMSKERSLRYADTASMDSETQMDGQSDTSSSADFVPMDQFVAQKVVIASSNSGDDNSVVSRGMMGIGVGPEASGTPSPSHLHAANQGLVNPGTPAKTRKGFWGRLFNCRKVEDTSAEI